MDIKVLHKISGRLIGVAQCKRFDPAKSLPPAYIRELYAVKSKFEVKHAYLVTARFSESSQQEAREYGVKLIEGPRLNRIHRKLIENMKLVPFNEQ